MEEVVVMKPVVRKKVRLEPYGGTLLVLPAEEDDRTEGGIVLPDSAKERPQRAVVVAVGAGDYVEGTTYRRTISDIKPGDVVLYAKYAGGEVKVNGILHLILRESDVVALERTE